MTSSVPAHGSRSTLQAHALFEAVELEAAAEDLGGGRC